MCFMAAIFTEYIGIHAVFGAFLIGIAFGDSINFSGRSKDIIHQFVANIFAPLFFVSIGLKVDFIKNFDLEIVLIILLVSFIAKVLGGYIGGRLGKLDKWESLAVGFGINARGAMEIILGVIAVQAGLISEKIFVALTIMAIVTSLTSGNLIRYFLNRHSAANKPT
jgi:Kef-type K+ transport system membrane component KefB